MSAPVTLHANIPPAYIIDEYGQTYTVEPYVVRFVTSPGRLEILFRPRRPIPTGWYERLVVGTRSRRFAESEGQVLAGQNVTFIYDCAITFEQSVRNRPRRSN